MNILDFSKFSFGPEEIRAVSELVYDEVLHAPEIEYLHTVYPRIVTEKEVGFIGEGGLVGVKNQGCDPKPQEYNIASRLVKWTPEEWEILIHACWKELRSTAALYSLKTGTAITDFTNSDYMAIVIECLANSMKEFVIRLMWFNDKDAANYSDNGIITNGIDIKYFNIIDGFWKQIENQVTANSNQLVTIAENATGAMIPKNKIQDYLEQLVWDADILLTSQTNTHVMCTQSFYNSYAKSLQGVNLETMYTNLTEGLRVLNYNGVPLVPMPIWDKIIKSYYKDGNKVYNPHRAVYITPSVLGVGVDDPSSFSDVDVWYDRDSRKVKMEAMGISDAKLLNPAMFKVAM